MKKRLQLCVFMALAALQVFGSSTQPSQFSSQTPKQKAARQARLGARAQAQGANAPTARRAAPAAAGIATPNSRANSRTLRPHSNASNPPISQVGFITATQIPAGGGSYFAAVAADFNSDGKQDVAALVASGYNSATNLWNFAISVILSNGNGTFHTAALTGNPNGDWGDEILTADLNGDGKPDLLVVHTQGPSTCDVFLGNGDGTFTLANASPVAISPNNLGAGVLNDVNGDGKLDLIVIDTQGPANLSVMLGNGDGTFQPATSVGLSGGQLSSIVFADFNGDGQLDFAATDSNSNGQTIVYLAQPNGSYVAGFPLVTAEHVYGTCSTAAGDLNGDGKPDIVTVNCDSNTDDLTIYLNNGDGTFQSGAYYAPGENSGSGTAADIYPLAVTIADVNGDGKNDIISSNNGASDVTVLLGNGDGTVTVPNLGFATGGGPQFAALIADFNGDGLADIIVPDYNFSFVFLPGYGDGTFRAALDYFAPIPDDFGAGSTTIASGDLNGDGYPDFVVGNNGYNPNGASAIGITVFLSRPDGSLRPGVNYGSGGTLGGVAVADFDGDKILDIAAVDYSNNIVQIFHGRGDGTFTQASFYSTGGTNSYLVVTGDFNQDGHPDLAIANWNTRDVAVLLNDGTGAFLPAITYPVSGNPQAIVAADLNQDGILDLAVCDSYPGQLAVLSGNPDGTFQAASVVAYGYNYLGSMALGDLDGDGIPDLAVAVDDWTIGTGIALAKGNGDGTFQPATLFPTTLQNINFNQPYPGDIKMLDLDGDGKLDLIYTNVEYSTVGVLFNTGANAFASGMFYDPVEYPAGNYPFSMVLADVNQDHAMDVVLTGDDFAGATVLLNNSGSGVQPDFALASNPTTATVTAGSAAAYGLTVTGNYGYNGTVTFTCGGLPAYTTCSFTPASVTANGRLALPSTFAITTTAATAYSVPPLRPQATPPAPTFLASLAGLGIFGLVFSAIGVKPNRRKQAIFLGVMLLLAMTFLLPACGGGSSAGNGGSLSSGGSPGTPNGTYPITITATGTGAAAITHTLHLTLVVQ